jgi:hypothetical protein
MADAAAEKSARRIVPASRMRNAIARRMTQSKNEAPHFLNDGFRYRPGGAGYMRMDPAGCQKESAIRTGQHYEHHGSCLNSVRTGKFAQLAQPLYPVHSPDLG